MRRLITCTALAAAAVTCAPRVPKPAGLAPDQPHISWIVMYGDRDNPDAEFACQSTGPRECVLPVSRPETRVYTDVHLYFHGTDSETTYAGSYRVELFTGGDDSARDLPIRITVRGEETIANHSVIGIVTEKPGTYALRLVINAMNAAGSTPIREDVPVQVR